MFSFKIDVSLVHTTTTTAKTGYVANQHTTASKTTNQ